MTDKELRHLNRADLLELLVEQTKTVESLRRQLEASNEKLEERKFSIQEAGSIAEALVTTATGLCISIPAVICHNHFVATVNRRIAAMESIATAVVIQVCGRNLVGKNL